MDRIHCLKVALSGGRQHLEHVTLHREEGRFAFHDALLCLGSEDRAHRRPARGRYLNLFHVREALIAEEGARGLCRIRTLRRLHLHERLAVWLTGGNHLRLVCGLPPVGKGDLKRQVRLVKRRSAEESVSRILAVRQAVDRAQELFAIPPQRIEIHVLRFELLRARLGTLRTIAGVGVRRHPLGWAAFLVATARLLEHLEHLHRLTRIPANHHHVAVAELVRLRLVIPTVLQHQNAETLFRESGELCRRW